MEDSTSVKVAIRVRPLLDREKGSNGCIIVLPNKNQLVIGKDQIFTFDHVFPETSTQNEIYEGTVRPLVDSCLSGYNATVLAYGQTGSGKTHTIEGVESSPVLRGVIPRAAEHLFEAISGQDSKQYTVRVSYLEIYLEEVRDLLSNSSTEIFIREDDKGNTIVQGLREVPVSTCEELSRVMRYGMAVRTTGATQMNERSSRSHAILTIHVERRCGAEESVRNVEVITGKFHFVDLAGSERARRTGNMGDRFKESVHINSGLLALGNVISALTEPRRRSSHVPYRASKITRLLKDSLGGNSQTLMIACVSPAGDSFEETLNSLKYAKRARRIQNTPVVNKDVVEVEMRRMESEILLLREQLKSREHSSNSSDLSAAESLQEMRVEVDGYRRLLNSAHGRIETCLRKKSVAGLDRVLTDIVTQLQGDSTDVSEDEVVALPGKLSEVEAELRAQVEQLREDLANDEKIFAEQQVEYDQARSALNARIADYQTEVSALKGELEELRSQGPLPVLGGTLNSTLKKEKIKITRKKPCTLGDIDEIIRRKTFVLLEKNIKNALSPPVTMATTQVIERGRARTPACTREDHSGLEAEVERLRGRVAALEKGGERKKWSGGGGGEGIVDVATSVIAPVLDPEEEGVVEGELLRVEEEWTRLRAREEELRRREEALQQRDQLQAEIDRLKTKELRASQVVTKDLLRVSQRLSKLNSEITRKSTNLSKTQTLTTSLQLEGELRELERKRGELRRKMGELEGGEGGGSGLSEEDRNELERLREELEIAECAISFRDGVLEEGVPAPPAERPINLPVTERITTVLFSKLLAERRERARVEEERRELAEQAAQNQEHLDTLNQTLISTQLEDPRVGQLERDVAYYKQLTTTLKQRLRNTAPATPSDTPRSGGGAVGGDPALTPVRKSKRELRPLTAEEVFKRTPGREKTPRDSNPASATSFTS